MKTVFIVPYYGKKPDYFDVWIQSAGYNPDYDFLFVSDILVSESFPNNVKQLEMSFDELKHLIQSKFEFSIELDSPYSLCDFKPAYGDIFEDYIKDYNFWGNCDTDQVFGQINHFLSNKILEDYDRILYLGHFSLYKNSKKMKAFYKLPGALFDYRTVYSPKEWYSFGEVSGTLQISLKNSISIYSEMIYVDTISAYSQLKFYGDKKQPKDFVFYWENGEVHRAYIENGKVFDDEWMYIHLQKRKMQDRRFNRGAFYITANAFVNKDKKGVPSIEEVLSLSDYKGNIAHKMEKLLYIGKQIKRLSSKSKREKQIWFKQRLARKSMLWPDNPLYK